MTPFSIITDFENTLINRFNACRRMDTVILYDYSVTRSIKDTDVLIVIHIRPKTQMGGSTNDSVYIHCALFISATW